jgi:serine/threonine protein kinase
VDRRADIWSFGAVLYEMLSGKRAFGGGSVADTLATVMKLDPDWSALPKETPASVHKLVRRCLTKDRKQRLQAIGEARIVLQDPMAGQDYEGIDAPVTSRSLSWIGWAAAAGVTVIAAAVSWIHFRERPPAPAPIQRFEIATPEPGANMGVISPDGSKLVLFVRAVTALNRGRPAQLSPASGD